MSRFPPTGWRSLDAAYLAELFADAHHRTFMHGATLDRPVEIVTLRVGATLPIGAAPRLDRETQANRAPEPAKIFQGEAWIDCARYTSEALTAGQKITARPSSRATPPPPGCHPAGQPNSTRRTI